MPTHSYTHTHTHTITWKSFIQSRWFGTKREIISEITSRNATEMTWDTGPHWFDLCFCARNERQIFGRSNGKLDLVDNLPVLDLSVLFTLLLPTWLPPPDKQKFRSSIHLCVLVCQLLPVSNKTKDDKYWRIIFQWFFISFPPFWHFNESSKIFNNPLHRRHLRSLLCSYVALDYIFSPVGGMICQSILTWPFRLPSNSDPAAKQPTHRQHLVQCLDCY